MMELTVNYSDHLLAADETVSGWPTTRIMFGPEVALSSIKLEHRSLLSDNHSTRQRVLLRVLKE